MTLFLHNTLSGKKEPFEPRTPGQVGMYVCGPTVYARPHIGNARSVVVYDVLFRLLRHVYGEGHVSFVRNITDVDDKINAAAMERGISIQSLTAEVTAQFHADMAALNCLLPNHEPRATQFLENNKIQEMIVQLIANGHAYVGSDGRHVLFDVTSYVDYGKLSGRTVEEQVAGARVAVEDYKKHPGDFVLWKPADAQDDPSSIFESPWGRGRPGWHIECSAMSTALLGVEFDIHGGGVDLKFPHHENEIAQSCCAHPGSGFAKYWVHNGFLTVNGEKMSKSLGNFVTVRELLDSKVDGAVIRYALLSTKYNKPLNWTDTLINYAKSNLTQIMISIDEPIKNAEGRIIYEHQAVLKEVGDYKLPELAKQKFVSFVEALSADINTSKALFLMDEIRAATRDEKLPRDIRYSLKVALHRMCGFIGLDLGALREDYAQEAKKQGKELSELAKVLDVNELIDARIAAKKEKNWGEADRIRDELKAQGIVLEDRPDGTTDWRRG